MNDAQPTMMDYADPTRHRPPPPLALRLLLGFASWLGWAALGFLGVGVIVGASMLIGLGPLIGFMFGVTALAVVVVSARCAVAYRRRTAALLVGYLEQAVRLNLPLAPLLSAVERGESESLRPRLAALRLTLEQGAPVGEALLTAAPGADRRTVELLTAAERNGALPQALARLYRDEIRAADTDRDPGRGAAVGAYALSVAFAQACLLLLIAVFVMPKFEQIFKDFRMPLPPVTRVMTRATGTFSVPVGVAAGIGVVWLMSRSLRQLLRQRAARGPLQNLWDRLAWAAPVAGRLARDRGLADALHVVGDAIEAGRPAPDALAEAQLAHVNVVLRHRIARWAQLVDEGEGFADAARRAGMPRLVVGLIATAQPADLVNALRFLARYYGARFSRLTLLLNAAAAPMLALVFGAVVAAAAVGVLVPLIRLADSINPTEVPW
jgi:type IV pilus assembly protein PilC